MTPLIRDMKLKDVGGVHRVECACFRSPWSRGALAGELRNDVAVYHVLELEDEIIGYAGMWVLFEEAHVTNVAVMEGYRRRGYARQLMLSMMRAALKKKATAMTLEVREHNAAAQALYEELGFHQNGYRPRYYSDTGEGALLMWNTDIEKTLGRFEHEAL